MGISYLVIYIVISALSFICLGKFNRVFYWLSLIFLIVFSAFRYEVGCDWATYREVFELYSSYTLSEIWLEREPGFFLLNKIVNELGLSFVYVNVTSTIIFFFGLHQIFKRQPNPIALLALAFPVLIINMPMSAIRQAAAIGIMCIAFLSFVDKRFFRYIILVLLASFFHNSSIIFLLLIPFLGGKYGKKQFLLAFLFFMPAIYLFTLSQTYEIASYRYIQTNIEAAGAFYRVGLLLITALAFQIFLRRGWQSKFPEDYDLVQVGVWLMVLLLPLTLLSSVIGDRLSYYLVPIQLIIWTRLHCFSNRHDKLFIKFIPYAVLFFVFVVWTNYSYHFDLCYSPYKSWFYFN